MHPVFFRHTRLGAAGMSEVPPITLRIGKQLPSLKPSTQKHTFLDEGICTYIAPLYQPGGWLVSPGGFTT